MHQEREFSYAQERKISEVSNIAAVSEQIAKILLQKNSWECNRAICDYLDNSSLYSLKNQTCDTENLKNIFNKYSRSNNEEDIITIKENKKFCDDMGIDIEGRMLYGIGWILQCKNVGVITRKEFIKGFSKVNADSISKIKQQIRDVKQKLNINPSEFKCFYFWAFDFHKKSKERENMDKESAIEVWKLLFPGHFRLLDEWIEFLKTDDNKNVNYVTQEQWKQLYIFSCGIIPTSNNLSRNKAWHVIDAFIKYQQNDIKSTSTLA